MRSVQITLIIFLVSFFIFSCEEKPANKKAIIDKEGQNGIAGKLFIIGGGKRPAELINEMLRLSGTDSTGYVLILPQASAEPDCTSYYASRQFKMHGAVSTATADFEEGEEAGASVLDSIQNASLIYITGGEQLRFMKKVLNTPVHEAIKEAYYSGAVIAGTSAGAAVMSKLMITGNEFKHPVYTGDFRTIEADNLEITEGLGLLQNALVDQHFIRRMRMNRLLSVALEYPGHKCIGIDESTAIIVENGYARVAGLSQVIVIQNDGTARLSDSGLLAGRNLKVDVLIPGDTIKDVW